MTPDLSALSAFCHEAAPFDDITVDDLLDMVAAIFFDIREVEAYLRDHP